LVTLGDRLRAWWLVGQTRVVPGLRRVSRTVCINSSAPAPPNAELALACAESILRTEARRSSNSERAIRPRAGPLRRGMPRRAATWQNAVWSFGWGTYGERLLVLEASAW